MGVCWCPHIDVYGNLIILIHMVVIWILQEEEIELAEPGDYVLVLDDSSEVSPSKNDIPADEDLDQSPDKWILLEI